MFVGADDFFEEETGFYLRPRLSEMLRAKCRTAFTQNGVGNLDLVESEEAWVLHGRWWREELGGASICIQTGTTTELNLANFARANDFTYEPVPIETNAEARASYAAERCDVYTTDISSLEAMRATFEGAGDYMHMIYPERICCIPR